MPQLLSRLAAFIEELLQCLLEFWSHQIGRDLIVRDVQFTQCLARRRINSDETSHVLLILAWSRREDS